MKRSINKRERRKKKGGMINQREEEGNRYQERQGRKYRDRDREWDRELDREGTENKRGGRERDSESVWKSNRASGVYGLWIVRAQADQVGPGVKCSRTQAKFNVFCLSVTL